MSFRLPLPLMALCAFGVGILVGKHDFSFLGETSMQNTEEKAQVRGLKHSKEAIMYLAKALPAEKKTKKTTHTTKSLSSQHPMCAPTIPEDPNSPFTEGIQCFDMAYIPHELGGYSFFMPQYALHRKAVQSFGRGKYFEFSTHKAMKVLLSHFPGSMVHAGTFFGDMVPDFSSFVGSHGHLYAFEPNTKNYLLAQMVVEKNRLDNVLLVNGALGDMIQQARIQIESSNGKQAGGSSKVTNDLTDGIMRVPQMKIDMFNVKGLSVIQLDVEGFEAHALRGAMMTLERERPIVALEDLRGEGGELLVKFGYMNICRYGLEYYAPPEKAADVKKLLPCTKSTKSS